MPGNQTRRNKNKNKNKMDGGDRNKNKNKNKNKSVGGFPYNNNSNNSNNSNENMEGGDRNKNKNKNKSVGGRKTRKAPSEWNKKVMKIYYEMKEKNPATKLGDAMRHASELKKKGKL